MELVYKLWYGLTAFADMVCEGHKHAVFVQEDQILICEDLADEEGCRCFSREHPCYVVPRGQIEAVAARMEKEKEEEEERIREEEEGS